MIKFTIDLKIDKRYGLNVHSGAHWSLRKEQAKEIHELVYYSMKQQKVIPAIFRKPVIIQISYNSVLDVDNHGYLTKFIIDGMKGYLLKDDKKEYVKEIRQKFWGERGILVEIWEA